MKALRVLLAVTLVASLIAPTTASAITDEPEVTAIPADAFEPDDTMSGVKPVTVNGLPQARTIHEGTDADWVTFPVRAGGTYVVDTFTDYLRDARVSAAVASWDDLPNAAVRVEMYDAEGRLVGGASSMRPTAGPGVISAQDGRAYNRIVWRAPRDMNVYVRITPLVDYRDDVRGRYLLSVARVVPSITGRLTAPDGTPAANVRVLVEGYDVGYKTAASAGYEAYTDRDGRYVLFGLREGSYRLRYTDSYGRYRDEFYKDARDYEAATPVEVTAGRTATHVDCVLDFYPVSIHGRVVDESGTPIPDAQVAVYYYYSYWWYSGWYVHTYVNTDADGHYELRNLSDQQYRLGVQDPYETDRFQAEYYQDASSIDAAAGVYVVDGVSEGSRDMTVSAVPSILSGRVLGSDGTGLYGVRVSAYDADTQSSLGLQTYTQQDGSYSIRSASASANVVVVAEDMEYDLYAETWNPSVALMASATPVPASAAAPASGVDIRMRRYPPSLAGKVTSAASGKPVSGVIASLYVDAGYYGFLPVESCRTGSDGTYRFQRLYGREDYTLRFVDPLGRFASEWYENEAYAERARMIGAEIGETTVADTKLAPKVARVYGDTRFDTAAKAAAWAFPGWAEVSDVIIASGDPAASADPLSAASLTWAYDAPLLLTSKSHVPRATYAALAAIKKANPGVKVHIVGGPGSVPAARLADIGSVVGTAAVERLPYGDRYETGKQVALRVKTVAAVREKTLPGRVLIANGADEAKFFDALSASAVSARTGAPILLVAADTVPKATASALATLSADDVTVVGGTSAVSSTVYRAVRADRRAAGEDRYATSVALANLALDRGWLGGARAAVAATLSDAVAGGSAIGRRDGVLLVTPTSSLSLPVYRYLDRNDDLIGAAVVFGGPQALAEQVRDQVSQALEQ